MDKELTEEDVFANDIDPLDAIRELRRSEGVAEEDLIVSDEDSSVAPVDENVPDDTDAFEKDPEPAPDPFADKEPDANTDEGATPPGDEDPAPLDSEIDRVAASEEAKPGDDAAAAKAAEAEKTPAVSPSRKFRANGQEFEFTEAEILSQFETVFGQSMDYTQKMQKIAPFRKMISALESEGVTAEQLNVAIDALKGDKGALQELLKVNNIDNYDLTPDSESDPYTPKEYGKNETELGIEEITAQISNDEEYKITVDVIDQQWDNSSREIIASNPGMIKGLHNDIKSGLYDKVSPAAMKMKVLDGNTKSDIEYYMLAGEQYRLQLKQTSSENTVADLNKPAQDAVDNFDEASSEAGRKRAAGSTGARADRKGVIDYLDDDDEAYDAWYAKNIGSAG